MLHSYRKHVKSVQTRVVNALAEPQQLEEGNVGKGTAKTTRKKKEKETDKGDNERKGKEKEGKKKERE